MMKDTGQPAPSHPSKRTFGLTFAERVYLGALTIAIILGSLFLLLTPDPPQLDLKSPPQVSIVMSPAPADLIVFVDMTPCASTGSNSCYAGVQRFCFGYSRLSRVKRRSAKGDPMGRLGRRRDKLGRSSG